MNPNDPIWQHEPLSQRETYEDCTRLIEDLPIIGAMELRQAVRESLRPDSHADAFEVHIVLKGCLNVWIDSPEKIWQVHGGMASITLPGQLHGGVGHA